MLSLLLYQPAPSLPFPFASIFSLNLPNLSSNPIFTPTSLALASSSRLVLASFSFASRIDSAVLLPTTVPFLNVSCPIFCAPGGACDDDSGERLSEEGAAEVAAAARSSLLCFSVAPYKVPVMVSPATRMVRRRGLRVRGVVVVGVLEVKEVGSRRGCPRGFGEFSAVIETDEEVDG